MSKTGSQYFVTKSLVTGSKAIDALLDSKWGSGKKDKPDALFQDRESAIEFMNQLLEHKFFHRAQKVIVKSVDDKKRLKKGKSDAEADSEASKKKTEKKSESKNAESESSEADGKGKDVKKKKNKEKTTKKVKLDMHLNQVFVDGKEPFVWIYDPIPLKAWFIGFGLVIGAVLLCLFPLWPRVVRTYVYYLSIAAAGFLFFIIGLAVLRFIVFVLVWCMTMGRHHLWMLPNLTEDVGFFASFWPLYTHEYKGPDSDASSHNDQAEGGDDQKSIHDADSEVNKKETDTSNAQDADKNTKNEGEHEFEILDSQDLTVDT